MSNFENDPYDSRNHDLIEGSAVNTNTDDEVRRVASDPYKIDYDLIDTIRNNYAKILDQSALNVADPVAANIGYFNNTGKRFATDPPNIGKTYIFITRPNCNFRSANNIIRSHVFQYYFGNKMGRSLMQYLMHPTHRYDWDNLLNSMNSVNARDIGPLGDSVVGGFTMKSDMVLPHILTSFIPLLSNTCTETSNAKDLNLETQETDGDFSGNKLVYASGLDESLSIGEVTLSFDDLYYSPVMNLFILWIMYIHYACKGIVTPYWEYIVNRIIDYTCSIYVFMLDMDQQTIVRYVRYSGCFPRTIPYGAIQHSMEPNSDALRKLQITFSYNFYDPMNPMSLIDFNIMNETALINRNSKFKNIIENHTINPSRYSDILKNLPVGDSNLPAKSMKYSKNEPSPKDYDSRLFNRAHGSMYNNWYGTPFIFDDNTLRFI
jgi:hypothetical protein